MAEEGKTRLLREGDKFGDYTVVKLLGKGGMGAVYHARVASGSEYAVKILFPDKVSHEMRRRFAHEAEFAIKIRNKNLVSVFDVGEDPETGLCYMIMDYLPGGSLADRLQELGRLPVAEAVSIASQVAMGLETIHRHGLVHRDVKPDNILFDANGVPKLADLGIAKFENDNLSRVTTTNMIIGTPAYMAPEQVLNSHEIDARADIYSLGVVLYEMLMGKRPNEGAQLVELIAKAVKGDSLFDERELLQELPEPIVQALSLMCAPKPEDRPQTALAAAEILRKAVSGISLLGKGKSNISAAETAELRAKRRKRVRQTAIGMVLAGLAVFMGFGISGWVKIVNRQEPTLTVGRVVVTTNVVDAVTTNVVDVVATNVVDVFKTNVVDVLKYQDVFRTNVIDVVRTNFVEVVTTNFISVAERAAEIDIFVEGDRVPLGKGEKVKIGNKLCTTPVIWGEGDIKKGMLYGSRRVSYERGGRRYSGKLEAFTVNWDGLKRMRVYMTEEAGNVVQHGEKKTFTLPGGATMEMIYVGPGSFTMGSPAYELGRHRSDEMQRPATLANGFWLGKYEVTQRQWESVMGYNPSRFKGDNRPVENVTWEECQKFVQQVNSRFNCGARLPTEAEWEYACRAGSTRAYAGVGSLDDMGWYSGNSGGVTHDVGLKVANGWGFCDMHGNVYEYCENKYNAFGDYRMLRGGSWNSKANFCRSAFRNRDRPDYLHGRDSNGFRLCCSTIPQD